jgi:Putative Actinobacterial Holin-X, holin superfamily III
MPGEDKGRTGNDVTEVFDVVKAYATQETLGPLKDIGRWLGFGVAGIVFLSLGLLMLLIGLLRVLQTETTVFHGNWSWVPYVITLAVAVIVIAIALSRIKKLEFDGEEQGR